MRPIFEAYRFSSHFPSSPKVDMLWIPKIDWSPSAGVVETCVVRAETSSSISLSRTKNRLLWLRQRRRVEAGTWMPGTAVIICWFVLLLLETGLGCTDGSHLHAYFA